MGEEREGTERTPRNVIEQGAQLKYLTEQVAGMGKDLRELGGFIRGELSSKLTSVEVSNGERDRRLTTLETSNAELTKTVAQWKGMGLAFSIVMPILITVALRFLGK